MKILRRLAVLVLSLCVSLGVLTGCVGTGGGDSINPEPIDQTKSQLNVFNFNGGFGNDWLYAARSRFEEMYKDTEFERGKKGVQIRITAEKANGATWEKDLPNSNQEVIFTEVVNYKDFVAKGLILDITDIVEENLNEKYGENKAIKDKLTPQQVAYYKHNGKYYGIPHYASYFGITYDIELFDEELLYFAQTAHGDSLAGRFVQSLTETRSAGPDGKPGTNDDGLPATYADFFVLCDYMYSLGIKPLTFAGNVRDKYLPALALSLAADYEGLTQFQLAYTFSGTAENLVSSFDGANPVVANKEVRIDSSNGYEVFAQSGRYYGLSFLEKIVKNDKYVYNVQRNYNNNYTHINAQKDYIGSKKKSGQRIAMLIDGCFWESEATEEFDKLGQQYPSDMGKMQRRFGFMPLPKATSDKVYDGNKITLLDYINSLAFINANIDAEKIPLAKLFLQFCYTDESLREYSRITNTLKALDYTLDSSDLKEMTEFGRSVYELHHSDRTDIVYPYADNNLFLNNYSNFTEEKVWSSYINNATENQPVTAMRDKGISAQNYFEGIKKYFERSWSGFIV